MQQRVPPLVFMTGAWVAGLLAAHHSYLASAVPLSRLSLLALIPMAAVALWPRDRSLRLGCACALLLIGAVARYGAALPDLGDPRFVADYNDKGWLTVEGLVGAYPDERDTWTYALLRAEGIVRDGRPYSVQGAVLVRMPRYPEVHYGDRLRLSGVLKTPPVLDDFSYRDFLAHRGIYSTLDYPRVVFGTSGGGSPFWSTLYAVKDRARRALGRLLPDPEAGLLQGILLGIRSAIPKALFDEYNVTGTSHTLVISGANLVVVTALFSEIFARLFGRRRSFWLVLASVVLYVLLVGADMPVVRAGLMGMLTITARYLGRRSTGYVSLLAAALVMTAMRPLTLWDASFQLSFGAALGVLAFSQPLDNLVDRVLARRLSAEQRQHLHPLLGDLLITTLAAQILTVPIVALVFGRVSAVAPLANLLIGPVQPLIMSTGSVAMLLGMVPWLWPIASVVAWLPWLCVAYSTMIVRRLAAWPMASFTLSSQAQVWVAVLSLAVAAVLWWRARSRATARPALSLRSLRNNTVLGMLAFGCVLAWLAVLEAHDGRLHVAFLDVGEGDAALITTPGGRQILIDGGPDPLALSAALSRHMPFWDRSLDIVIATHGDADHTSGLPEVLQRYRVAAWIDSGLDSTDPAYQACLSLLLEKAVARHAARAGERLDLGGGLALEILNPPTESPAGSDAEANARSVVLRLAADEATFLFAADIGLEQERLLLASDQAVSADVLKVAHHGSAGSSGKEFLDAVQPSIAVVSVGAKNRYGHPAADVLERLAQAGAQRILRTDQSGSIEIVVSPGDLTVHTER